MFFLFVEDLWLRVKVHHDTVVKRNPPSDELCDCLMHDKTNGIHKAVGWVANHYETGVILFLLRLS